MYCSVQQQQQHKSNYWH